MHTPLSINIEPECGYAIIPTEKSLEYLHDEKEGTLNNNIIHICTYMNSHMLNAQISTL